MEANDVCVITDNGPYRGMEVTLLERTGVNPFIPNEGQCWMVRAHGFTVDTPLGDGYSEFIFPERRMQKVNGNAMQTE